MKESFTTRSKHSCWKVSALVMRKRMNVSSFSSSSHDFVIVCVAAVVRATLKQWMPQMIYIIATDVLVILTRPGNNVSFSTNFRHFPKDAQCFLLPWLDVRDSFAFLLCFSLLSLSFSASSNNAILNSRLSVP